MNEQIIFGEKIIDGSLYPIQPKHINTNRPFFSAFGRGEAEHSARYIVRLCQRLGGWAPFTKEEIDKLYNELNPKNPNPFSFNFLIDGNRGVIIEGSDGKYRVTHRFIACCFKSSPSITVK